MCTGRWKFACTRGLCIIKSIVGSHDETIDGHICTVFSTKQLKLLQLWLILLMDLAIFKSCIIFLSHVELRAYKSKDKLEGYDPAIIRQKYLSSPDVHCNTKGKYVQPVPFCNFCHKTSRLAAMSHDQAETSRDHNCCPKYVTVVRSM